MRPATLVEMRARNGLSVEDPPKQWSTFAEFVATYRSARAAMRTSHDVRRVVSEAIEDAAHEGAVWVELQTALSGHAMLGGRESALELILDAANLAAESVGVGCGIIVSVERGADPADAMRAARLATRYRPYGVVGFGLGGDERYSEASLVPAFRLAAASGLLLVPHAGEFAGPASVWRMLDALGADRVQHGISAVRDTALLRRLARERVCLDVCPTSNVALGVARSLADHPLRSLLAAGVPCSLNADGPLLFRSSLLQEYERCREQMGLDDHELASMAEASITASAAPRALKDHALADLQVWARTPDYGP
jgi:adenosine deaminase